MVKSISDFYPLDIIDMGWNAQMLLMRKKSFCHTLTFSVILLYILILSIWLVNVESAIYLPDRLNDDMTNQKSPLFHFQIRSNRICYFFFLISPACFFGFFGCSLLPRYHCIELTRFHRLDAESSSYWFWFYRVCILNRR